MRAVRLVFRPRVGEFLNTKTRLARWAENEGFQRQQFVDGSGKSGVQRGWNHHRAVQIGMHQIPWCNLQSENLNRLTKIHHVNERVTGPNAACDDRKARLQITKVTHQAIGERTAKADPLVHRGVNFSPPRALRCVAVEAFEEASVRSLQRGDGTAPAWLAAELDVGKADAAAATDAALDRAAAAL